MVVMPFKQNGYIQANVKYDLPCEKPQDLFWQYFKNNLLICMDKLGVCFYFALK